MVADSTPPPWSYDVPDYLTMGVSGKEVHGFEKNPYKSPAFLDKMAKCAVSNFVKQTSDPGAYSPGGPKRGMGDVTSHNKNSSQGLGAFGSRQERGEQFAMAARNVSHQATDYNFEHLYAIGRSSQPHHAGPHRSASPRQVRKAATPRSATPTKRADSPSRVPPRADSPSRHPSLGVAPKAATAVETPSPTAASTDEVALKQDIEPPPASSVSEAVTEGLAAATAAARQCLAAQAPPEGEASTPPREMKPASGAATDRSKPRAGAAERRRPSSPRSDMRSASFRSASPCRGGHVRPTITPGVGHYDYTDDPDKIGAKTMMRPTQSFSNAGSSVFAAVTAAKARSGSPSRPLHDLRSHLDPLGQVKEMVDVAPGSHNPRIDSIAERAQRKLNARSPGFGSSSARSTSINARHPFLG